MCNRVRCRLVRERVEQLVVANIENLRYYVIHNRLWLTFVRVRAGSNFSNDGGILVAVDKILSHENYNQTTSDFDIALLKVSGIQT